ncbi:MAG: hypothetical protein LBP59_03390 [Planctomycetaceae bacterium]|nr:hypothetical protein [Planctomycetaceae bacterium]
MLSLTGQIEQIFIVTKKYRIAGISPGFIQIRRRNACFIGSRASRLQAVVLNR